MKVEVINTGTELLLGNVVNAHLAYFGRALWPLGLRVSRQVTVPDGGAIRGALTETFGRADIVLVTGGLGPTTDDVTREIAAELLGLRLEENREILDAIRARCARRGYAYQPRMGRQALVPEGATVFPNANGTAPGLYLPPVESPSMATPHLFLLPGPPRELHPMFEGGALPLIRAVAGTPPDQVCRTFRCVGIGESLVESRIGLRLSAAEGLEVGYCARPNEVDLRLIGAAAAVGAAAAEVEAELHEFIVSADDEPMEAVVVRALAGRGETVSTAESCTGGLLADRITDVPGASAVFLRGWVTYTDAAKASELGVGEDVLAAHGAVSEPVARAMAEGARAAARTTYALATTGFAGPSGGTPETPVGTVWLALAGDGMPTATWKECFPTDRKTFKHAASQAALNRLRLALAGR